MTETYFIIKNDVTGMYKINEDDPSDIKRLKLISQARDFATFNPDTKTWKMQLPKWFCESEFEEKAFILESYNYYKPDGTMDLGTSLHCPLLSDGQFSQHDNMICMANDGIERIFYIDGRTNEIEFWFKDYMSDDNLDDHELLWEQKKNEQNQPLYYYSVPSITKVCFTPDNTTSTANNFPILNKMVEWTNGSIWYITKGIDPSLYLVDKADSIFAALGDPVFVQRQAVYYDISPQAEIIETIEPTDFPALEHRKNGDKLVYLKKPENPSLEEINMPDLIFLDPGEEPTDRTAVPVYTYKYDDIGNKVYLQIWNTSEEEGDVPVLTTVENEHGQIMYMEEVNYQWFATFEETDQPIYVAKPYWGDGFVRAGITRYYKFREGITHRKTTKETDLPVYSHCKNWRGDTYYAKISIDPKNEKVIIKDVTTAKGDGCTPIYVHERDDSGQKLYWETVCETTVDTGDPVLVEKNYEASFVMICRLRC